MPIDRTVYDSLNGFRAVLDVNMHDGNENDDVEEYGVQLFQELQFYRHVAVFSLVDLPLQHGEEQCQQLNFFVFWGGVVSSTLMQRRNEAIKRPSEMSYLFRVPFVHLLCLNRISSTFSIDERHFAPSLHLCTIYCSSN